MTWVSTSKLTGIMNAIRSVFVTGRLKLTDAKSTHGVWLDYTSQDGVVKVSPVIDSSTINVQPKLYLCNHDETDTTSLTHGVFYCTKVKDGVTTSKSISIYEDVVKFRDESGSNSGLLLDGVSEPTSDYQAANKKYVDALAPTDMTNDELATILNLFV